MRKPLCNHENGVFGRDRRCRPNRFVGPPLLICNRPSEIPYGPELRAHLTSSGTRLVPILSMMCARCTSIVRALIPSCSAISLDIDPRTISCMTCRSRDVRRAKRDRISVGLMSRSWVEVDSPRTSLLPYPWGVGRWRIVRLSATIDRLSDWSFIPLSSGRRMQAALNLCPSR